MDLNDTEVLTVNALGAADNVVVEPLGATDLRRFNLNLGVSGAVDGAIDTVTVNGTTGDDTFQVTGCGHQHLRRPSARFRRRRRPR